MTNKINRPTPNLNSLVYGKIPPQASDLENNLLGCLIMHKEIVPEIMEIIPSVNCFYQDKAQKIYQAIISLQNDGAHIDTSMVVMQLRKQNDLELIGGAYEVSLLTQLSYHVAHAERYARLIMEKHIQRELIRIGSHTISEAYKDEADVFDILGTAEYEINALQTVGDSETIAHISEGVREVISDIEDLKSGAKKFMGVDTGIYMLTQITKGWQNTDLIIQAARPSQGKSALSIQSALSAAISGTGVVIFSLEMGIKQVTNRLISCHTGVELEKIITGSMNEHEERIFNDASMYISSLPIYIDDRASSSIQRICNKIKMMVRKNMIGLAMIDYLQLCGVNDTKGKLREQQISEISRTLKITAKDCEIPIIALSQMNRGIDTEKRKPQLSDLRESGAIEQDADIVIFIHHEDGKSYLLVRKHRNGACEEIEVVFKGAIQRFLDPNEAVNFQSFKSFSTAIQNAGQKSIYGDATNPPF